MNHRDIEELITSYLLGDLEPGAAERVRKHLDECESCRALARDLEPTLDLLRGALAADVVVPEQLDADRKKTIRRRRTPAPLIWLGAYARPLAYAASAVAFLGALALVLLPAFQPAVNRSSGALSGADTSRMELAKLKSSDLKRPASDPDNRDGMATFDESEARRVRPMLAPIQSVDESPGPESLGLNERLSELAPTAPSSIPSGASIGESVRFDVDAPELPSISGMVVDRSMSELNGELAAESEIAQERFDSLYAYIEEDGVANFEEWRHKSQNAPIGGIKADPASPVAAGGRIVLGAELVEVASKDRSTVSDPVDRFGTLSRGTEVAEVEDIAARENLGRGDLAWFDDAEAKGKSGLLSTEGVENQVAHVAGGMEQAVTSLSLYQRMGQGGAGGAAGDAIVVADAKGLSKKEAELESIDGFGRYSVDAEVALGEKVDAVSTPRPSSGRPAVRSYGAAQATDLADDGRADAFLALDFGDDDGDAFATPDSADVERLPARKLAAAREEVTAAPFFRAHGVNPFMDATEALFSTFSIDVDTASYTVSRKYMQSGMLPPAEAVRTEEFINFFDYGYRAPRHGTFAIYSEAAPTPFGEGRLLKIGVKGRHLGREEQKQAVLTFVIDTSGSMDTPDRLGLIKKALGMLVEELSPTDRVAIVQVDSDARLVLEHTPASEKDAIRTALDAIQCSGSTHLEAGMQLGYEVAARAFVGGAANRVLLLSDGAANLGSGDAEQILSQVAVHRTQGITCSVFGFGMGTYNDEMLETLADKGDGTYQFIDSVDEAQRVFVSDLAATLNTIAGDVKIQVEFNPSVVARYRQIGYENRQLRKEQFRDDTVDAGEVGSGQSVTALYEIVLHPDATGPLGTVRVRYQDVETGAVEEIEKWIAASSVHDDIESASVHFRLAAAVAEFAEILRGSPFAEGSGSEDVARVLRPVALDLDIDPRVQELLRLVTGADDLPRAGE